MSFTYDFPMWTIVSWVLIASLFVIAFQMRRGVRERLAQIEPLIYGRSVDEEPNWEYENFHRAASEMMLRAVTFPEGRFAHLAEAEVYARRAIETARTEDQRRFTTKLVEAIENERRVARTSAAESSAQR